MASTPESKQALIEKFRRDPLDTGSPEVQVALLTARVEYLSEHLKGHSKDHASRRGLIQIVGQRRRLLRYLRVADADRYQALISALGLRR